LEIEESETIILYKRKNPFRVLNYSTAFTTNKAENQTKYPVLQQHFIGWFIKSEQAVFNMEQATFMDFSVKGNTVLCTCCLTLKRSITEYTLFSHQHLKKEEYENEIKQYIEKLALRTMKSSSKRARQHDVLSFGNRILKRDQHWYFGGWTKASTLHFQNSDKNQVNWLPFYKEKPTSLNFIKTKFWFYDLLLLDILDRKTNWVPHFSSMFKKRKSCGYFQISRRGNLFIEDIQVILKCPKMLFIKAILTWRPALK
jgi:lycopene beta-cyclase